MVHYEPNKPGPGQRLSREPALDLSWLIAGRICLLSMGLLAATFFTFVVDPSSFERVRLIYGALVGLFLFCIASALWIRFREPGPLFTYMQIAADVLSVTGVVYITGGPISPFLFLYLPPVMVAAILRTRRAALLTAACGAAAYGALVYGLTHGVLRSPDGTFAEPLREGAIWLQQLGLISAMVLIAVATSYLRRKLAKSYELVAQSQRDLVSRQTALIEGIPDGVITVSSAGLIVSINSQALELLQATREQALGRSVHEFVQSVDPGFAQEGVFDGGSDQNEFALHPVGAAEPLRLLYHRRPLLDAEGQPSGSVVIFQDVTKLRSIEDEFELQERMARMLAESARDTGPTYTKIDTFVGESPVMQKVFKLIDRVAQSDATVLIGGESGTGKELVARAIHLGGTRAGGPFVPVNCGAIPENLIESELFGHKKGAFTGAHADHIGLFRQAQRGTIFLDEIGELPVHMQSKLLRAIQEKSVRPVGADHDVPIDLRIVAATNKNLKDEIKAGKFREDLYYRLNVITIRLPALRDRREDIPLLVNSVLRTLCKVGELPVVTPAAMQLLLKYDYPGNVRELENILERATVLGTGVILAEHLPDILRETGAHDDSTPETAIHVLENLEFPVNLDEALSVLEKRYLEMALSKTKGAKKKAASLLGINFRSFRYRLQKYGMQEGDGPE